jgi:ech hydrogenase subunit D
MIQNIVPVTSETLAGEIAKIKFEGYKFITMTCVEMDANTVDVIYHFDKEYQLKNFRLTVSKDAAIPSISHIFMAAFLVENEIQDLFDVKFSGLIIDFKRTLYFDDKPQTAPLCRYTVNQIKSPETTEAQEPQTAK